MQVEYTTEFYGLVSSTSVLYPTDLASYFDPETLILRLLVGILCLNKKTPV
jgi:hypothetical protein